MVRMRGGTLRTRMHDVRCHVLRTNQVHSLEETVHIILYYDVLHFRTGNYPRVEAWEETMMSAWSMKVLSCITIYNGI